MTEFIRKDFCIHCRKETKYILKDIVRKRVVKGKEYEYRTITAQCEECGEEMAIPGLIDCDNAKFDEAYRKKEGLVSVKNIEDLMKLYNLGKAPISIALGFGEITITRYLAGQMPSKEYSDIIRKALNDPYFMLSKIEENAEKLGPTAYKKATESTTQLCNSLNGISKKMISTIAYLFSMIEDITPLTLQKILYFSQGINLAVNKTVLFDDDCEAWIHGPVYENVYQLFKEFKYSPIDDTKYVIFQMAEDKLNETEKIVIQNVINTFGIYSGKVLEDITHNEDPWKLVRNELDPLESSNRIIPKSEIEEYFTKIGNQFDLTGEDGINQYINFKINSAN